MKKIALLFLALLSALTLFACGGETEYKLSGTATSVMEKAALKKANSEALISYDSTALLDNIGIASSLYTDFAYSVAGDLVSCETIAVFVASDSGAVKSKLEAKLKTLQNESKNYNEDNYAMASAGVVEVKGNIVYMVISPNKADIVKAIEAEIK